MEIVARLTSDAEVSETKSGKRVVNFDVAINDYYKPKNGEGVQVTTYVRCAYWLGTNIATHLIKGVLVQLYGRPTIDAYVNKEGNPVGVFRFQVSAIKLHSAKSVGSASQAQAVSSATASSATDDDLPF